MKCIYCGGKTKIINSRAQIKTNQTWRRHKCQDCLGVFTSVEAVVFNTSLLFKRNGKHVEPFERDKLFSSIYEACKHRNNAVEAATSLTATCLGKLLIHHVDQAAINREKVVKVVLETLKRFDKAAMVQYQAFHPL